MERTISSSLATLVDQQARVDGWLHNFRELGKIGFVILRDRGGFTQVVVTDKDTLKEMKDLQPGSVLRAVGMVKKTDSTDIGVELTDAKIEILVPIHEIPPVAYN